MTSDDRDAPTSEEDENYYTFLNIPKDVSTYCPVFCIQRVPILA